MLMGPGFPASNAGKKEKQKNPKKQALSWNQACWFPGWLDCLWGPVCRVVSVLMGLWWDLHGKWPGGSRFKLTQTKPSGKTFCCNLQKLKACLPFLLSDLKRAKYRPKLQVAKNGFTPSDMQSVEMWVPFLVFVGQQTYFCPYFTIILKKHMQLAHIICVRMRFGPFGNCNFDSCNQYQCRIKVMN